MVMKVIKQEALLKHYHFEYDYATGHVYGHPKFRDGTYIHTSRIVNFNKRVGVIETLHTFYKLEGYEREEAPQIGEQ